jgi:hypothetical protein
MIRRLNGQCDPRQRTRTTAPAGSLVTRSPRSSTVRARTDQPADTVAGIGLPSWWSPQGGFAFAMRPGLQVATKLAKRVAGWRPRIL